ncbi:MAG TPA: SCO family protein [Opitutaceae bacterium]|nr:SCO family protein [Opitutaceae bacterium]
MRTVALFLFAMLASATHAESTWSAPAAPGVGFDQHIGATLPLDTPLRDETGARVRLGAYFGRKPVVMVFGYARCPQLCTIVASGAVDALRGVEASAGRDYELVYASIDPADTPRDLAALKQRDVGRYGRTGAERGWHCVAGDETAIRGLTAAAGFRYTFDPRSRLYAHASGFLVATPDGRIARYFLGVDFTAKDVAAALERAAAGKTGEPVFNLLLVCARGLGISGRYGALIWSVLTGAVLLTVVVVFGGIAWMLGAERRAVGAALCREENLADLRPDRGVKPLLQSDEGRLP